MGLSRHEWFASWAGYEYTSTVRDVADDGRTLSWSIERCVREVDAMTKGKIPRDGEKPARNPAVGKIEEGLGWVTGDRKVEAEGHTRHQKAERLGRDATVRREEVEREERKVRR